METFLKLRNNITLEGDIQLSTREVKHLFDDVIEITLEDIECVPSFVPKANITSYIRKGKVIGYIAKGPKVSFERLATLLSFIQEIWTEFETKPKMMYSMEVDHSLCTIPMMAMSEFLSFSTYVNDSTVNEILCTLTGKVSPSQKIVNIITRSNTSSPHVHSFHKYKAKNFPRFTRSLMVSCIENFNENYTICDPYVGSGTTLVESSLLGYNSFGYDIDPLSCFISEVKTKAINIGIDEVLTNTIYPNEVIGNEFHFPIEISKKFIKWHKEGEMRMYEAEIGKKLSIIEQESGFYKQLCLIALSDALTRKFAIRMMGTGSGRFALEINSKSLDVMYKSNIQSYIHTLKVIELIKRLYNINTAIANVYNESAINRKCKTEFCDLILTSPPYLPASSGRENYLVSKIISLKALNLLDNKETILSHSVGSMTSNEIIALDGLPSSVAHLYNWLINDELRKIKATPIVAYYNSLKKSLYEDMRTIKKDGKIIYIIGKESVFYRNATREILYKVKCDEIFVELAESIGIEVCEVIDIELDKRNSVVRPRSQDKYYETAIIMRKR